MRIIKRTFLQENIHAFFYFCLFLALGLRLSVAYFLPVKFFFPDALDYHQIALHLVAGEGFALAEHSFAFRAPVYPLFLSVFYQFDLGTLGIRLVQALLGGFSAYLVYHLTLTLLRQRVVALVACFLFACDPLLIVGCSFVLTETLFTFFLLLSFYLLLNVWKDQTRDKGTCLFLGITLGITTLCRASMLGLIPLCLLFLYWELDNKKWRKLSFIALGIVFTMLPWSIRNFNHFGGFVPVTTQSGIILYEVLGPGATGGPRIDTMKFPAESNNLSEWEKDKYLRNWTLNYVLENPDKFFSLAWAKMKRFWNPGFNDTQFKTHPLHWGVFFFFVLLYFYSFRGVFRLKNYSIVLFLLLPILYFALLHCVFMGSVRFRMPIHPFLEILAAYGLYGQKLPEKQLLK